MTDSARAVAKLLAPTRVGLPPAGHWHQGVVTAIAAGPPPTVTVKIGGTATATAGLRYMSTYAPVVGDTVWLLTIGTDNIVFGPLQGTAAQYRTLSTYSYANNAGTLNATSFTTIVTQNAVVTLPYAARMTVKVLGNAGFAAADQTIFFLILDEAGTSITLGDSTGWHADVPAAKFTGVSAIGTKDYAAGATAGFRLQYKVSASSAYGFLGIEVSFAAL